MTKMSSTMSCRQICQFNCISQFCKSFTHIAKIRNVEADTLFCLEINAQQVSDFGINCEQFAVDQKTDAATLQPENNPKNRKLKKSS